jgi:hypothetical protein
MRTTVTLDKDVEVMLRDAMHRSRKSFKETLNAGLRAGLGRKAPAQGTPFVVKARPMGLRAGIDPTGFKKLADDLEVDAFLESRWKVTSPTASSPGAGRAVWRPRY